MPEENNSLKIALLEQRMNDFFNVINKLESAIEKISEVNTNIIKMLAVHEEKIGQNEKNESILAKMDADIKVDATNGRKEITEKFEQLVSEIEDLKRYKWMSVAFGMVAALVVAGGFQLASSWDVKINSDQQYPHPQPAPLTTRS
jgi:hypothetical protein